MRLHLKFPNLAACAWLSLVVPVAAQTPGQAEYDVPFVADATYDPSLPTPEDLLGYKLGSRAATAGEIELCVKAWAEASDRAEVVEYARSHEGRPLHYVIVSDPANLRRLEAIKENLGRLGDPRDLTAEQVEELIGQTPPVAWLAYTIHGDETEGSDAALAVLYYLLADTREATRDWLREMVVIIDPLMNPDGRDRFLKMVAEHRGTLPNFDDQSAVHAGYWPFGRGNHYLFDLNRDQILAVHPETRGRLKAIGQWNPLLLVDAHGMGSQDTHLFSPPRPPINPNIPANRRKWGEVFAADQAKAFDQKGWLYYTGEWHEEWYPGYTDAWASYRGAIGILYEQASIAEDGVRRPGGRVLTYRESVHHHVTGSLANLDTLYRNRHELWHGFVATRREASDPGGPYANRTFAVAPTPSQDRSRRFIELMELQGFEIHITESPIRVPGANDQLGRRLTDFELPAGSLLLSNRQPLGHLLAAMLEFDPKLPDSVLKEERKEVLARSGSKIYDTTAWNLTMMYGLSAYDLPMELPAAAKRFTSADLPPIEAPAVNNEAVALVIDGADDRSVATAVQLMRDGIEVRVSRKPFELAGQKFARGSLVVTQLDQRGRRDDWRQCVYDAAGALGLVAAPLTTGLGSGDLPDLGGEHFVRLEPPRVAMAMRDMVDGYDYGSIWHLLDHRLHLPHSQLNMDFSAGDGSFGADLARYNVLVLPARWSAGKDASQTEAVETWVKAGGTLIGVGSAVAPLTNTDSKLSQVRQLEDVLGELDDYELAVWREWMAAKEVLPEESSIWSHRVTADSALPWKEYGGPRPAIEERKRRDAWQSLFMPAGSLLAGRVDPEHWLTFGCPPNEPLPLMIRQGPVLMSKSPVQTPVRLGLFIASESESSKTANAAATEGDSEARRPGWAMTPPGHDLYLRMSGLLWPEATHRLANAAYVTREAVGDGQVILFADSPNFRASTLGSARLMMNALVYGPGLGAKQPIRP